MRRFTMVLAAAVATAMLVVAVSALDAIGADPPAKAKAPDDLTTKLADCLRGRGIAVPALTGDVLDHWLQTHSIPDADGRACKQAVAPAGSERREASSADVKKLSECLRLKGFDVPSDPLSLKQWVGRHSGDGALDALKECGVASEPGPAPCGEAPKAPRPDADTTEPTT